MEPAKVLLLTLKIKELLILTNYSPAEYLLSYLFLVFPKCLIRKVLLVVSIMLNTTQPLTSQKISEKMLNVTDKGEFIKQQEQWQE